MTSNREESDDYQALVARLNDGWRVITCRAGIQWIIQRRAGSQRHGADRWLSVAFHRLRDTLITAVHERCGDVRPEAVALLVGLPTLVESSVEVPA